MTIPWITKIYAAQYTVHELFTTLYRISRKGQTTKQGGKTTKRKESDLVFSFVLFSAFFQVGGREKFCFLWFSPPFLQPIVFSLYFEFADVFCRQFSFSLLFSTLFASSFAYFVVENKVNSVPTKVPCFCHLFLSPNRSHLSDLQVVTSPACKGTWPKSDVLL